MTRRLKMARLLVAGGALAILAVLVGASFFGKPNEEVAWWGAWSTVWLVWRGGW